jgi:TPP-dependent pyruvate/acetoin dehydrogenase alpha subunit
MPAWAVDGMDVEAVEEAARHAVDQIRGGHGPVVLELRTYRFRAHSMYDPERYRDKEEVARWRERDPIDQLAAPLRADGVLDDARWDAMRAETLAAVDRATEAAENAPLEPVEELTRFVYSEREVRP